MTKGEEGRRRNLQESSVTGENDTTEHDEIRGENETSIGTHLVRRIQPESAVLY
jgi:hypothetical protein